MCISYWLTHNFTLCDCLECLIDGGQLLNVGAHCSPWQAGNLSQLPQIGYYMLPDNLMPAFLSVSAATNAGQLTYDDLYNKLSRTKEYVDRKVLSHMILFFAAAIPLANPQLLSELYDLARASPLSSTKAILREDEGLVFDGAFMGGTPSR